MPHKSFAAAARRSVSDATVVHPPLGVLALRPACSIRDIGQVYRPTKHGCKILPAREHWNQQYRQSGRSLIQPTTFFPRRFFKDLSNSKMGVNIRRVNPLVKQNLQLTGNYFCGSIRVHNMSTTFYNLSDSADRIGISRRALYKFYLQRYPPAYIGGHPVLSNDQIKAIRAERRIRQNGKKLKPATV